MLLKKKILILLNLFIGVTSSISTYSTFEYIIFIKLKIKYFNGILKSNVSIQFKYQKLNIILKLNILIEFYLNFFNKIDLHLF